MNLSLNEKDRLYIKGIAISLFVNTNKDIVDCYFEAVLNFLNSKGLLKENGGDKNEYQNKSAN
jgi:hypothetical protein